MAITKQIIFKGDATDAVNAADQVADSFKKVDKEAGKANKQIEDVTSNGGAIAILDRLTGGLASQFRDAFEATKLFNGSLKATRGALLATGIGALVVALGAVVAYWDEIVDFVKQTNENLEKQLSLTQQIQETLASESAVLEKQIELNELQGVANEELQKQQIQLLELRREQELKEIDILEAQLNRLKAQTTELTLWDKVKVAAAQYLGLWGEVGNVAVDRVNAQAEEIAALEAKLNSARESALDLSIQLFKIQNPEQSGTPLQDRPELAIVGATPTAEPSSDPRVILEEGVAARIKEINEGLTQVLIEEANRRQLQAEVQANSRLSLEQNTWAMLRAVADEGSEFGKGVAIAGIVREQIASVSSIISNTAAANAKAVAASPLTSGQPWVSFNTIAAGLGIGASVAGATRSINDILSDSQSPTQEGANFGGGGGAAAPSFNLVRGTGENQLLEGITRQQNPIEAYVVSDRVTSSAALNRNRASEASLG